MTVTVYDDMVVRRRLLRHCEMAGSEAAFARKHGFHETYVRETLRGEAVLSVKLLRVLGYERVTRYVEVYVPIKEVSGTTTECSPSESELVPRG